MTDTTATHEHEHVHSADEERGHNLSMQCWRAGQRAKSAEEWQKAVDLGREAVGMLPGAPEARFNLAVALTGLAAAGDGAARAQAAAAFDEARGVVAEGSLVRYAAEAVALLEKRPELAAEPVAQYALGTHLAALGKLVRARRALESAAAAPDLKELAEAALADTPEPVVAKAPPVGRNDPCPCGSGKKYKKCHGA
jgi:tetratricopeptide (TPR) repeat protein